VYCIAILTDQEQEGQNCAEYIRNYCTEKKVFPLIEIYQNQEQFFGRIRKTVPAVVFLALPGVSGLNAAKVLELSDKIIAENNLTALMVTHNMHDAIVHGNRLIMMGNGKVILDISGEEKKKLTVDDLLQKFEKASGSKLENDRMLLSKGEE